MKTNAEKLPSPWVSAMPLAVLTLLLYVVIRAFGGEAINGGSRNRPALGHVGLRDALDRHLPLQVVGA